jgi:hypothetical protein
MPTHILGSKKLADQVLPAFYRRYVFFSIGEEIGAFEVGASFATSYII